MIISMILLSIVFVLWQLNAPIDTARVQRLYLQKFRDENPVYEVTNEYLDNRLRRCRFAPRTFKLKLRICP